MAPAVKRCIQAGIHPSPSGRQGKLNGTIGETGNFIAVLLVEQHAA